MLKTVEEIRRQLDGIDDDLIAALAMRFECVDDLAELKREQSLSIRDAARERDVLGRVLARARSLGLDTGLVRRIFEEVIGHSTSRQMAARIEPTGVVPTTRVVVGYQGVKGAFSHLAAGRHFRDGDHLPVLNGYSSFREVVAAVLDGTADYGMLPIENTTAGSINEVYDLLATAELVIIGEEVETVDHCLLTLPGATIGDLRRIRSHPQAIAQCGTYLAGLAHCRIEAFEDTAGAARQVQRDGDPSEGAIASAAAAEHYGLRVLHRGIANQRHNYTRFVAVARTGQSYPPGTACKTSVIMAVPHCAGALATCLECLACRGINLTKIESRPKLHAPWEYLFYLDLAGDTADPRMSDALHALDRRCAFLKVLGSYPMAIPPPSQASASALTDQDEAAPGAAVSTAAS